MIMMTPQEIFDKVARHLLTQNAKSVVLDADGEELCRYRGDGGMKCAAGALIEDTEYDPRMEGYVWRPSNSEVLGSVMERVGHPELVGELQGVHDGWEVWFWPKELRRVAANHGLSSQVVDELRP